MLTPADIAATIRDALTPLGEPATYRVSSTSSLRTVGSTAAGSISIVFGSLPAGFTGLAAGDTFMVGATTHTVTAPATPSGGTVTATFNPALVSQVAGSTQVVVSRATDHAVRVLMEQIDGYTIFPGVWGGGDYRFTVFDLPADLEPKPTGHKLVWRDKILSVQAEISRDQTGAAWLIRAK